MIRGYVSSDEDEDEDDYMNYYEGAYTPEPQRPSSPIIQSEQMRNKLNSAIEKSKNIDLVFKAVNDGDLEALEQLGASGVSFDEVSLQDWTPLMRACGMGKFEIVQYLLEHSSDPNIQRESFTPLMACCTETLVSEDLKLNCIRLLLQHGADVNAKDKYRTTSLMYASSSGYLSIVNALLEVPEIDVNIQDREGWTALHHAVNKNYIKIVERLLSANVDLNLKDKFDRTVLNLAVDKNLKNIAVVLGYTEESVPTFPTLLRNDQSPTERFLNQLPDPGGQGGFTWEAENFLAVFNKFGIKNVGLPDLLNMTEKDLHEVGVKVKYDRKKILAQGIHLYHLHPWTKSSMPEIVRKAPMSIQDVICVTGDIVKHLTIANASLRYLEQRVLLRQNKGSVDVTMEKDLISVLVKTHYAADCLNKLLPKILRHIEKIKPEMPADFIYKCEDVKGRGCKKYIWSAVWTAAAAGCLIYCFNTTPSPRRALDLLVNSLHSSLVICSLVSNEYSSNSFESPMWID